MEAVAYRIGLVFEQIKPFVSADPVVVASGGALLSSPAWLQVLSDVLARPIQISSAKEASLRGAALLALESMGESVTGTPVERNKEIQPDPERHAIYLRAMERQQDLYQAVLGPGS